MISELYTPEETSTGYVLTRIAEALTEDFEVGVLCGQPTYSARGTRAPVRELRNGVGVRRCARNDAEEKNRLWGRLINFATAGTSMFVNALRKIRRHDVVCWSLTNPPLLPFLTVLAARIRGAHSGPARSQRLSGRHGRHRYDSRRMIWERLGSRLNGGSIEPSIASSCWDVTWPILAQRKMARPTWHRIEVIPNWADTDSIVPEPKSSNALLHELGTGDAFVRPVHGNMGRPNNLDVLVEAATRLRADASVRLVLLGSGARRRRLELDVRERRPRERRPAPATAPQRAAAVSECVRCGRRFARPRDDGNRCSQPPLQHPRCRSSGDGDQRSGIGGGAASFAKSTPAGSLLPAMSMVCWPSLARRGGTPIDSARWEPGRGGPPKIAFRSRR